MRQRRKYDEKILQANPYAVGQYVWLFQNVIPPNGTKKTTIEMKRPVHVNGSAPAGSVPSLGHEASGAL